MRSWMYSMRAEVSAGSGLGDTKSWFLFYRWEKSEEVWLPLTCAEMMKLEAMNRIPGEGDDLWLFMVDSTNAFVYGKATITRLFEDNGNGRWEIWYDASKVKAVPEDQRRCQRWPHYPFQVGDGWHMHELNAEDKKMFEEKLHTPS